MTKHRIYSSEGCADAMIAASAAETYEPEQPPHYTVAGSRSEWDNTGELRIVRNLSHRGREERLQQKFYCRENGAIEWVDVPVVDERGI